MGCSRVPSSQDTGKEQEQEQAAPIAIVLLTRVSRSIGTVSQDPTDAVPVDGLQGVIGREEHIDRELKGVEQDTTRPAQTGNTRSPPVTHVSIARDQDPDRQALGGEKGGGGGGGGGGGANATTNAERAKTGAGRSAQRRGRAAPVSAKCWEDTRATLWGWAKVYMRWFLAVRVRRSTWGDCLPEPRLEWMWVERWELEPTWDSTNSSGTEPGPHQALEKLEIELAEEWSKTCLAIEDLRKQVIASKALRGSKNIKNHHYLWDDNAFAIFRIHQDMFDTSWPPHHDRQQSAQGRSHTGPESVDCSSSGYSRLSLQAMKHRMDAIICLFECLEEGHKARTMSDPRSRSMIERTGEKPEEKWGLHEQVGPLGFVDVVPK